jgi:hypothetical protein
VVVVLLFHSSYPPSSTLLLASPISPPRIIYSHHIHFLLSCTSFMNMYSYDRSGCWMKVPYTSHNLHYRGQSHQTWLSVIEELRRIKNSAPPLRGLFVVLLAMLFAVQFALLLVNQLPPPLSTSSSSSSSTVSH